MLQNVATFAADMKRMKVYRQLITGLFIVAAMPCSAQQMLTLDSCRAMALHNNKQMQIAGVKQEVAANVRRSARTKYLPHVSAVGTYEYTSREISLLSDEQKTEFSNLGTAMSTGLGQALAPMAAQSQVLATVLGKLGPTVETMLSHRPAFALLIARTLFGDT